ncbi:hypothetical protein [Algibacter pacificus]|uniref:hypothetical protein n=1 Tax=Algibacter pacificus TaxID=2599389 RepID=UPI0011CBBAB8|nr:hypothetical protein [Algibacter pacificus]
MKKIIGVLGIALIAIAMFLNTNTINNSNLDLANLISLNTANAEDTLPGFGTASSTACTYSVPIETTYDSLCDCFRITKWEEREGTNYDCSGWQASYCEWSIGCTS